MQELERNYPIEDSCRWKLRRLTGDERAFLTGQIFTGVQGVSQSTPGAGGEPASRHFKSFATHGAGGELRTIRGITKIPWPETRRHEGGQIGIPGWPSFCCHDP
jgi:hypothetical protein